MVNCALVARRLVQEIKAVTGARTTQYQLQPETGFENSRAVQQTKLVCNSRWGE